MFQIKFGATAAGLQMVKSLPLVFFGNLGFFAYFGMMFWCCGAAALG